MALPLKPATPADIPAIVTLMNAAFRGTGPSAGWNTEGHFIEGNRTTESLLREELAAKPNATFLLLRGDDPAAPLQGCVFLEPKTPETWYLGSLSIPPALQSTGLGRSLLDAAEQYAAQHGARTLTMHVVNIRHALIAWYERRGYQKTEETHPFPYGDNRFGTPLRNDLYFIVLEKPLTPLH